MRKDLYTGELFKPKRITQKFANANNRIAYHNLNATKLRHSVSHIQKPLNRNLKLLNELMDGKKEATFHKQYLMGYGVSLKVHSHVESYLGKNYYAIFHYIIFPLENDKIKIIRYD